jgi:dolichyl-phosphate beta-glucosyltransferase
MTYALFDQWRSTPSASRPRLSVVIPTFNEAERIVPTLAAIAVHISRSGLDWECIVSDDGSTDGTAAIVEDLALANLRILRAPHNRGKGAAVRAGMLAARGDLVLFCDADNSTPIDELDHLMSKLEHGTSDVVVGSRASAGASVANRSNLREALSRGLQWLVRLMIRTNVRDTQCGFKLFTRTAAQSIFSHQRLDGFAFDLEVLYLARRFGFGVSEEPVRWFDAPFSKVNPLIEPFRFLRDVVRIRGMAVFGAYREPLCPPPTSESLLLEQTA